MFLLNRHRWGGGTGISYRVGKEGLSKELTTEQRPEGKSGKAMRQSERIMS